jgi:hypothetical protein
MGKRTEGHDKKERVGAAKSHKSINQKQGNAKHGQMNGCGAILVIYR